MTGIRLALVGLGRRIHPQTQVSSQNTTGGSLSGGMIKDAAKLGEDAGVGVS